MKGMGRKCTAGLLIIAAVMLFSCGVAVAVLYKLQQSVALSNPDLLYEIHKSVSTIIIGTGVAVTMILLFLLFFNLYYMRPVRRINRGLRGWLNARTPFNVSFEGGDELAEMCDMIELLVEQNKRAER